MQQPLATLLFTQPTDGHVTYRGRRSRAAKHTASRRSQSGCHHPRHIQMGIRRQLAKVLGIQLGFNDNDGD